MTISPRWRKVLRDLWHNKTRTVLVIISIAIGVMSVGMISGSQIILERDMLATYLATNPRHAVVFTSLFDEKVARVIEKMPAVADAEGRREFNVRVGIQQQHTSKGREWHNLELHVIHDYSNVRINTFRHVAGALTPPKRTMLLERQSLEHLGLSRGDEVIIQLDDGFERKFTISGAVHDVNQVSPVFSNEVVGYITPGTLTTLGLTWGFDELNFTVAENPTDREHILAVTEKVKQKLEQGGIAVRGEFIPEPGKHWAHENTQSMLYLLGVLGILSLLLSGFLVINTMSALLTQHVPQIGMMKAVGARAGQLTGVYVTTVLIYGLLSLLVAVPLGALGAYGLTRYITGLLNFDIVSFEIAPRTLAMEIAVGIVTPLLAALVPIWVGVRVTVREAISTYGLGRGHFGQNRLDKWMQQLRGIPRPMRLSLRNTIRRKTRLIIVLLTLSLASSIFISVMSVQASLMLTLDDTFRYWNYDYEVNFDRAYRIEALEQGALAVQGVKEAEAWGFRGVVRKRSPIERSDRLLMIAPTPGTKFIDPIVMEGRWLRPDDTYAVVINSDLRQEEPDLEVGGNIVLEIDDKESVWQIVGLVKQPLSGPYLYINFNVFGEAVGAVGKVGNVRVAVPEQSRADTTDYVNRLEQQLKDQGFQVSDVTSMAQERDGARNQMNIIVIFLLIMAVLLAVVGGLGLMGTMFINVMERTREVGVMRAIGASNGSIMSVVIVEGVVIGLISWAFGILVSLPLSKVMSDQVGTLFLGAPATYQFSVSGAILWLGIVAIIAALASFLPAWNAARITVREALVYQ